jgi:uncharacterized protein (DUF2384 family)
MFNVHRIPVFRQVAIAGFDLVQTELKLPEEAFAVRPRVRRTTRGMFSGRAGGGLTHALLTALATRLRPASPSRSDQPIMTQALSALLGHPMTPRDTLDVLRNAVGFSDKEAGRALQVTDRSIKRWRTGAPVSAEYEEQLHDLARILATLVEYQLPPANIRAWFLYRNRFLGDERPIDIFATGGYMAIQPALAAIADGVYG